MTEISFNIKIIRIFYKVSLLLTRIFFVDIIKSIITEDCSFDEPILVQNLGCKLSYCNKAQFESNYCSINNTIVKTQWLNNIIKLGGLTYRYINFVSYSNGNMVVETTCYPGEPKRYFYGLKANGRPLFTDKETNNETPYYMKETYQEQHPHKGKYEAEAIVIKSSESNENNGKEYFLSVSKLECYAEIFDFKNDNIYIRPVQNFNRPIRYIKSTRHSFFPLKSSNQQYYYVFGFVGDEDPDEDKNVTINFQKHIFNSISQFSTQNTNTGNMQTILNGYGRIVSGFQTSSGLIIVFYFIKTTKTFFNIRKYEIDFTDPKDFNFESNIPILETYCKCIFLQGETGVFSYFKKENNVIYPFLLFKEFDRGINYFKDFLANKYTDSKIKLDKRVFYGPVLINDIIRLNENKICFSTVVESRETIYIILVNIFGYPGYREIKIRYYSIRGYELYHFKILYELRIHNYNNFVAFASSYCENKKCDNNDDEHYTALMIFSYPNSTDIEFDLEKYLYENDDKSINDTIINLDENLIMQNNIFGYIVNRYDIENVLNCGEYKILLAIDDETIDIRGGAILNIKEKLKFAFTGTGNIFPKIDCLIQYYFVATEPDLNTYDDYPEFKVGDDDSVEDFFQKNNYFGRLSNYIVKLPRDLTTKCNDNCNLCVKNEEDYCITCKYNYSIISENNAKYKKCKDNPIISTYLNTDEPTQTDQETEKGTEKMTQENTEKETDKETDGFSEVTDKMSEEITNKNPDSTQTTNNKLTDKVTEYIEKFNCDNKDIIQNKCTHEIVPENQMHQLSEDIKKEYLKEDFNGKNNIVKTENAIFQITKLDNQTNSKEAISNIDLGKCEEVLKRYCHLPETESLIIYKLDIKTENLAQTYVQYEIYNPINLEKLNLSLCENEITISTKLNLDSSKISLYESLKSSGYDLFNKNDSFYTDICSRYTSQNGTDVSLSDRNSEIFNSYGNISLCQSGCKLVFFDSITQDIKCNCNPQLDEINSIFGFSDEKFFIDLLKDSILDNIKHSNFLVLKCYKLALDLEDLFINIGRLLMTFILFLSLIFFIYFFPEYKKIKTYIISIINNKIKNPNNFNKLDKEKGKKCDDLIVNKKRSYSTNIKKRFPKKSKFSDSNLNIYKNKNKIKNSKLAPPKRNRTSQLDKTRKKSNNSSDLNMNSRNYLDENLINKKRNNMKAINDIKILNTSINSNLKNGNTNINIIKIKNIHIKKIQGRKRKHLKNNKSYKELLFKKLNNSKVENNLYCPNNTNNLIEEEINLLDYNLALELDKRTLFQYYASLLKAKQLIISAFCSGKDYNLFSIKICLLLTNFSLYLTINCFFFNDKTMHRIYIDGGAYGIVYRLPQIFYTLIISAVVNIILRKFSLSQKILIELKQENFPLIIEKTKKVKKLLIIKFVIFFTINFLLICFFWYFVSCFCAVFTNTQLILIWDSLVSFGVTLLYPFFYNLIPGILRISSLRERKKNKECLYKTERVFALI